MIIIEMEKIGEDMHREEVEGIPDGFLTALINGNQVAVVRIAPEWLTVRVEENIDISSVQVAFYNFEQDKYKKIEIKEFVVENIRNKKFWYEVEIFINNQEDFQKQVRKITAFYQRFVYSKSQSYGSEFSKELVGYPEELDWQISSSYEMQRKIWMSEVKKNLQNKKSKEEMSEEYRGQKVKKIISAISLQNSSEWTSFEENSIEEYWEKYKQKNYLEELGNCINILPSHIYVGNSFCNQLFPEKQQLEHILIKAKREELDITIVLSCMQTGLEESRQNLLDWLMQWVETNKTKLEVEINDYGTLVLIQKYRKYLVPILGTLLQKRRKDPRMQYKNQWEAHKKEMKESGLQDTDVQKFLSEYGVLRYELESCGYEIEIPKGRHSLHLPCYQTNTSQFCPLYAKIRNGSRGMQNCVKSCPGYCEKYAFLYPDHLRMTGRYNSLFGIDLEVLENMENLEKYIQQGIDRIVWNW